MKYFLLFNKTKVLPLGIYGQVFDLKISPAQRCWKVNISTRVSLGQVKSTEGNDFEVTFLRAKDDEHKSFPTKEDCSWVKRKEILSVVDYWVMDKPQVYLFSASLPVTELCLILNMVIKMQNMR